MKFDQLPKIVQDALTEMEFEQSAIEGMTAREVFVEYCRYEGLLGSWPETLWELVAKLRVIENRDKSLEAARAFMNFDDLKKD